MAVIVVFALAAWGDNSPLRAANGEPVLLHLRYATFDPVLSPAGQSSFGMVASPAVGVHPYIVQFNGPILEEWKAAVIATGARIVDYIPDYAYVVLTDAATSVRLRALASVRWVGYLQPLYRIDPALSGGQGVLTVTVSLFADMDSAAAGGVVRQSGGTLIPEALPMQGAAVRATMSAAAIQSLASQPNVAWIEPYRQPRLWNEVARAIMSVSPVWTAHDLRGQGQTIAIADSGLDTGDVASIARDFRGRIVATHALGRQGDWSDPDGHGTHVAGSALGNGLNSGSNPVSGNYNTSHAGVAPEAGLVLQSIMDAHGRLGGIPSDLGVLLQQAYSDGARVHSNSWGIAGDEGRVYDSQARQVDKFTWEHPDMLVVFAAGNDGEDEDRDGVVDLGSITTPATAKNALSVGASESVRMSGGYNTGNVCSTWGGCWPEEFPVQPLRDDRLSDYANGMAAYSSRGPAPDGRRKPDLVAPGTNILSTRSSLAPNANYWGSYDEYYAYDGGTSMSAPLAAGAAAIVRQHYQLENHNPSAALVKATLLAGAVDITPGQYGNQRETPPAPNNVEGWGRLDLTNALYPIPPRRVAYVDATVGLTTGRSLVYTYTVASGTALRVILAWSDYPGSLMAYPNLVNDLDLKVTGPATTTTTADSSRTADTLNNVEGVLIDAPAAGYYVVTISGRNVPFGPQPFALVVSGDLSEPPAPATVVIDSAPGFAAAGTHVTVTWGVSGGSVITATSLLWDQQSHVADHDYANAIVLTATSARSFAASFTLPASGTVYLTASAWVDGRRLYAEPERVINVVRSARSIFLPVIFTYPAPQPTPTPPATTTPAVVVQIVRNGGFEDAAPQSPPWQQSDRADPNGLLVSSEWPNSGMWSVALGGFHSNYQQIYQSIAVPAGSSFASLVFHWYMVTEDSLIEPHDVLYVRLLNAAGEPLLTVTQRDNTRARNTWTTTRYSWAGDFPYGGQTLRLSFEMVTDAVLNTNLYLDDVSFFVSRGPIEGAPGGSIESGGR